MKKCIQETIDCPCWWISFRKSFILSQSLVSAGHWSSVCESSADCPSLSSLIEFRDFYFRIRLLRWIRRNSVTMTAEDKSVNWEQHWGTKTAPTFEPQMTRYSWYFRDGDKELMGSWSLIWMGNRNDCHSIFSRKNTGNKVPGEEQCLEMSLRNCTLLFFQDKPVGGICWIVRLINEASDLFHSFSDRRCKMRI